MPAWTYLLTGSSAGAPAVVEPAGTMLTPVLVILVVTAAVLVTTGVAAVLSEIFGSSHVEFEAKISTDEFLAKHHNSKGTD